MMDKMYEFDPKTTIKIVEDLATVWGITSSPMTFAYENKLYDIVAHIGCQKALNFKWYNDLPPETWAFFKSLCDTKNIKQCNFFRSPVFRFVINYLMFLTMLISYSSYVMTSIDDVNYTRAIARVWEYYTYIWAFGDFIEEAKRLFRGVFTTGDNSHRKLYIRFRQYIKDFWNLIDILSYILLIIALFVRHFYPSEDYNIARRLFSLSLLVMYLRFLEIFFISHRLGTQLLMIKEMLKDLIDFLYVMIIIIVGVGIYYHANLFPNHLAIFGPGSIETWSFWKVFYYPYWQLYGETFTEYLEGKDLSNCISNMTIFELDPSQERCPREEFSVPVVSAFYFLISNLLLVNLVIAKFSYTFDAVQTNSVKLWKYQRYTFVTDYESKIPSPFNLIFYLCPLYWILRCKKRSTCCLSEKQIKKTKKKKKMKREHRLEIQKIFAGRCINI
ncbi:hypothetical protein KUTeg_001969 [Tegillarca granosa]|uniref:Ion transport domain-containing protein n=1 Tax=Tegillarca granosa TaxID=220873 RepID=A0ABQ9FWM1_TEGGR|nr:hypothetical protein KUTeg_001969 [Tegillarca granosa]